MKMAKKEKNETPKKDKFQAFSKMKMPSLWTSDKAMKTHKKNVDALKQAHGIVSGMIKDVSEKHSDFMHKNLAEMQVALKAKTEHTKDVHKENIDKFSTSLKSKMDELKKTHENMAEKIATSKEKMKAAAKEHKESTKNKHSKLHSDLESASSSQAERMKVHMEKVKAHHKNVMETWQQSTQRIMDVMKSTAKEHVKAS